MRVLLLSLVVACGGTQDPAPAPIANVSTSTPQPPPPPPKTKMELALEKMGEFRDAMCKCAAGDSECAKRVADDMTKWSEAQPRPTDDELEERESDPEQMREAEEIGKQLGECMQTAMMPPQP